ncbi:MAG: hypothetical protein ACJ8EY_01790 [Sphingomicrobium sp.]
MAFAGIALIVAHAAAAPPSALAQTGGGLWEVTGIPGTSRAIRRCVGDTRALGQIEHRAQACPRTVVTDSGTTAVVQYNCGRSGFGSSNVTVVTPRSLRIATQGISGGLPFNYVVQVRRVGDCRPH